MRPRVSNHVLTISVMIALSALMSPSQAAEADNLTRQHIVVAREYMENAQWDYAGYEWRAALAQTPHNPEASVGLAETLMSSGYPAEAVRQLRETRRHVDKLAVELVYGKALELAGDPVAAETVYLKNLQRVPLEQESFRRLISLVPTLPPPEQANLKRFLKHRANEASRTGKTALKKGDYPSAANHLAISALYVSRPDDINDYGVALTLLGKYDDARHQFAGLEKMKNVRWEYWANSALAALGKARPVEAAGLLEKAINQCGSPSQKPLLYNDLGYVYENQGKWQKARTAYERAIELNPAFDKAKLNLAYVHQKDRAYDQAIQTYLNVLQSRPDDAAVLNRLGFVYELAHKERQAIDAYRKAARSRPGEKDAHHNLALLYRKMGKTREADQAYKQMMAIEFKQIEAAGKSAVPIAPTNRDPKTRLLDFVDVFFSEVAG